MNPTMLAVLKLPNSNPWLKSSSSSLKSSFVTRKHNCYFILKLNSLDYLKSRECIKITLRMKAFSRVRFVSTLSKNKTDLMKVFSRDRGSLSFPMFYQSTYLILNLHDSGTCTSNWKMIIAKNGVIYRKNANKSQSRGSY